MEDLKMRYEELYRKMANSKDVERMKSFGSAATCMFNMLAERNPDIARKWLDKMEASEWHNYLSEQEAIEVVAQLKSQDGRSGAHWSMPMFSAAVESLGGNMERPPYYNKYALWATANMLYSDHAKSAKKYVGDESKMPAYFYDMAVEKLTDIDRPHFVREYFHLG
ncbi:MAG: hypothetical protein IJO90_04610 [Alistipes sp.]|nr:hypothetical protein [Alistipes sp.]MBQ9962633.1 hypothetical protein [Alistipes sp.]